MVRDEADIIGYTIRHLAAEGVNGITIADNLSKDATRREIQLAAAAVRIPVEIVDDPDPAYFQGRKMTALARRAADRGATWIIPFDADELWYAPGLPLASYLRKVPAAAPCVLARRWNHMATAADDPADSNPFTRMRYRQKSPIGNFKCAFRWHPQASIIDGNHGIRIAGEPVGHHEEFIGLRHFPYRSPGQLVTKIRNGMEAIIAGKRPPTMSAHWRNLWTVLEKQGEEALRKIFEERFFASDPTSLIFDPAPSRISCRA
jgi:hypothetical protein